ncbi:MAG: UDP-N-acetylmuramoyl-L-alanyl-D-glutamate--2,6-diaminopimelate ligase [Clostridia bacterium]|nr:UDP-N-acetylmuramoyl-L-alanyl-D-glutamate--2,6-diaminopimelate ligase [Clostridia bacterium]
MKFKDYVDLLQEKELIQFMDVNDFDLQKEVGKISYNSKDVDEGTLFMCKGASFKEEYLKAALEKAFCFVYGPEFTPEEEYDRSYIKVTDARKAMAEIANLFYKNVWQQMTMIGLTGTKGKTTVSYYLKSILELHKKKRIGFLSSVVTFDGEKEEEALLTTPETFELHQLFQKMVENKVDTCLMEVSSQALKYHRTYGITYDYGAFTNISNDHISEGEHEDFEDYFSSKLILMGQCKKAVVNMDIELDNRKRIMEKASDVITYGMTVADYTATNVRSDLSGIYFTLAAPKGEIDIFIPMIGEFNISNALCASAIACDMGVSLETIKEALKDIFIPGRMNIKYDLDRDVLGIVDFAHNTVSFEALKHTVLTLKPDGRYTCVYGGSGGKGINRRKDCTAVTQTFANRIILTEEDPGFDDNLAICEEIKSYVTNKDVEVIIIENREEAIRYAFETAKKGEVVMITGKGADTTIMRKGKYYTVKSDIEIMNDCI